MVDALGLADAGDDRMRALVAEDDAVATRLVTAAIEPQGFVVEVAETGEDALELAKLYDFDIAVIDMKLPDIDGGEVIRRMRLADLATPVLVLSGVADRREKVRALVCGADDYLTKPFDREELTARLQAIVRRSKGHAGSVIRTGRMAIDLAARTVEIDGKPLSVSPKEYGILELLSLRRGKTLTKGMFLDHLYGGMDEPEQKIVDVFICKLRKKIAKLAGDDGGIQTVWGHGYVLRDPAGAGGLAEAPISFLFDDPDALGASTISDEGAEPLAPLRMSELDLLVLQLLPKA